MMRTLLLSALSVAGCAAWALAVPGVVHLPIPLPDAAGAVAVIAGALLWALRPGAVAHPLHAGAVFLVGGGSILARSSAGLYLVTPVLAAASAALVWGWERGRLPLPAAPLLAPLAPGAAPLAARERAAMWINVLLPWLAAYELIVALGPAPDAVMLALPGEAAWPVFAWAEPVYASAYVVALATPWLVRTRGDLRAFQLRGWIAMAVVFPLHLALPVCAVPRPFNVNDPLGGLLAMERAWDSPAAAFPSFHVVWAMLCAAALPRAFAWLAWAWAAAVAAACSLTGMHTVADILAGVAVGAAIIRYPSVWELLRATTERVANSWHEWRFGPVRIINHGAYAGIGTFLTVALAHALLGVEHAPAIAWAACCGLFTAGAWAQIIEGSHQLMRPYGFYGGVLGIMIGAVTAPLWGTNGWMILGAYAVGAPLVQAWGRVRCLVQGCCHGRAAPAQLGIRCTHPRSRVVRLSALGGVPIHATPLYSILWNAPVFLVVARLWSLHVPLPFLCGIYLVMTGIGRFVEESLRGEPQTPEYRGLRLYQWVAIGTVVGGALMTCVPGPAAPAFPNWDGHGLVVAGLLGVLVSAALGVDFPESDRRFSRLA
ncbi:MAG: prolipoprotein diacylglyceryl transferase [Deltaproteobacteria bacterium]|nr:prolipoprotein diacylglyceryl transferase [Deltaproteobacteria bacterium]